MVLKGAVRYGIQQLAQRGGKRATRYVTQEYGQIAGSIVGTAIGIAAGGDFTSSISKGLTGDDPYGRRDPPFGYFDGGGDEVNGSSNGSFNQTLRPTQYRYGGRRYKRGRNYRAKCTCKRQKHRSRSRRRLNY